MSFTHVVTFKWNKQDVAATVIADALQALVGRLNGVERYLCGPDVGLASGSYDFAVVGTFDTQDHFLEYRDHPEHQRIIAELIAPNIDTRTVVQLES